MIQVKDLSKRFGVTTVVDRLNFGMAEGEILGFLGPNGAGKTTTMRMIIGYLPPSQGTVLVGGKDVLADPLSVRRQIGYLPESVPLYQDMKVGEYLRFVGAAKGLPAAQVKAESGRVMDEVGVSERANQLIRQLSKGFRQRLGLAQALLGDPPVLILDEPTIGLDPRQIVEIRSLIQGFAQHKTVILSSHILTEVAATCSRVLIINQGRLVADGPPAMLGQAAPGLKVVCRGDQEKVQEVLAAVPGVKEVAPQGQPDGGRQAYRLECSAGPEVAAAVAAQVVGSGLELIELTPIFASLEEVFVRLTTEQSQEEAA